MAQSIQRKILLYGFIAGALAVFVFHQGTQHLLYSFQGSMPWISEYFGRTGPAFNFASTAPLGVPVVVSQAFFGGLWGILLAWLVRTTALPDLPFGFVFGALVLTLVAFTIVATLKGQPMFAGGNHQIWWRAGLLNGAWGFGTVFFLRPFSMRG
ncbi:MAG: hypothetical protein JWR10_95 [Rubritepida sp.]|nr:hypothetical protein [Rubritepida sp.]